MNRSSAPQILIAYATLVVLGLTSGLLGVAWPSIRDAFGLPLSAVGTLKMTSIVGSTLASFNGGLVITTIGLGPLLIVSSSLAGASLLGYSATPSWGGMVFVGLLFGAGSGTMHVGVNTYFAAHHDRREMNWLHACFGLGATLGPLMMTSLLQAECSWRWGYGIPAGTLMLMAVCFTLTRGGWHRVEGGEETDNPGRGRRSAETLKLPIVWLSMLLFFIYTGVEVTAGQWAYSLFTEARGVAEHAAGLWTSVYWGVFTGGRLLLGGVADRLRVDSMLRLSILGIVVGAALLWWHPSTPVSFLGLALMGFAEAPVFPTLTSNTPRRVGPGHADNAIGFQVAAAGLGGAGLMSLAGVLAERVGLEIVGPFLLILSLTMLGLHEGVLLRARRVER